MYPSDVAPSALQATTRHTTVTWQDDLRQGPLPQCRLGALKRAWQQCPQFGASELAHLPQKTRHAIVKGLAKRSNTVLNVKQEGGFDCLEPWAAKEIASELQLSVDGACRRRPAASVSASLLRTLRSSISLKHSSIARASRSKAPAGGDDSPDGMRATSRGFPLSVLRDPYARRSLTRILTENQQSAVRCAMAFKTRHPYCAVPPPARRRLVS
ncbi:hypothetical protein EVJ58_g8916 [Rhodofomes roseus]|uniref:Uncharacterized protein n=1 Tax=Rhodofomes roseus TaxID=34475 RepID=A0A4Y9XVS0_9APHY|nr:hypothetical protein EVJ58_g8916 [Rhodofomes roseus]